MPDLVKLQTNLGGVKNMQRPPDAMFVVDLKTEAIAVKEAQRLRIPIIGLVDTNCDPDGIQYVIPGNDDAIKSCGVITKALGDVIRSAPCGLAACRGGARAQGGRGGRRAARPRRPPASEAEENARKEAEEAAAREAAERVEVQPGRGRGDPQGQRAGRAQRARRPSPRPPRRSPRTCPARPGPRGTKKPERGRGRARRLRPRRQGEGAGKAAPAKAAPSRLRRRPQHPRRRPRRPPRPPPRRPKASNDHD